jgi:hypothetical protein
MGFTDPNNSAQNPFHADPSSLNLRNYDPEMQAALEKYNATYGRQNGLLDQLLSANGGPNLANAQLQQSTNQNNLQAAGQIASVRGLNPQLAQRQILDTQAAQNQSAAGQASVNRLAQILASRQQAAEIMGQQQQGNAAMYGTGAGANTAQNNTVVNQQSLNQATAAQNANLRDAANQRQAAFIGSILQTAGNMAGLGGIGGLLKPSAIGGPTGAPNANGPGDNQVQTVSLPDGVSMPGASGGASGGGTLPAAFAYGGEVTIPATEPLLRPRDPMTPRAPAPMMAAPQQSDGLDDLSNIAGSVAKIAPLIAMFAANGGLVPGRAQVPGNSPANDTVLAKLSPGEVVIPRTYADNPEAAAEFIRSIRARRAAR